MDGSSWSPCLRCKEVPITQRTIQRHGTQEQIGNLSLVSIFVIHFPIKFLMIKLQVSWICFLDLKTIPPYLWQNSISLILRWLLKQGTFHYKKNYSNDFLKCGNPGVNNLWQPCSPPFCSGFKPTTVPAPQLLTAQWVLFPSSIIVSFQQRTRVSFSAMVWWLSFYYLI